MIASGIALSFRLGLLKSLLLDQFRIALYTDAAQLSPASAGYTTAGEVPDSTAQGLTGYHAGGMLLEGAVALMDGDVAILNWNDPVWPVSSITARGALIYNASKSNTAVAVLDMGRVYTSTNGPFTVHFPEPKAASALIRLR